MLELISRRLREVTVRPAVGADERCRWDALMGAKPFRGLVGRSVRHVQCSASTGWRSWVGTPVRSLRARDRWIGWLPEQQFRRLHLIATNARFLILPECAAANLASRVLGLSLRRLSGDFRAMHGHPILIAETFVDPARFTARATGRRTGRRWATPAALPASPARPRPGSPTADRRRSWSTRWPATRASNCAPAGPAGVLAAARMEEGEGSNTGSPVGGVARTNRNPVRGRLGRQGGGWACSTAEAG